MIWGGGRMFHGSDKEFERYTKRYATFSKVALIFCVAISIVGVVLFIVHITK